jgi:hypothetical protein
MKKKIRSKEQIIRDIKMKKFLESFGDVEDIELDGFEVKLKAVGYDKRIKDGELSEKFIKWYNENKETVFVAKDEGRKGMYELDGVDYWLFNVHDLLTKCEYCGEFVDRSLYKCSNCEESYLKSE